MFSQNCGTTEREKESEIKYGRDLRNMAPCFEYSKESDLEEEEQFDGEEEKRWTGGFGI